jgi:hypothetical protein
VLFRLSALLDIVGLNSHFYAKNDTELKKMDEDDLEDFRKDN